MPKVNGSQHDDKLRADAYTVEQRLTKVETTLEFVATKADLHAAVATIQQSLHAQTWKIMGFGLAIVGASFALARYV